MKTIKTTACSLAAVLTLSACAGGPMGPTIPVMPAPNKPFAVFQQDQAVCQNFTAQQVAPQIQAANNQAVGGALLGTLLGAGLGAALGGGRGAAIGAASGAAIGTAGGTSYSADANMTIQQQYNVAYQQCMYARGNQVPGYQGGMSSAPPPPPPSSDPLVAEVQTELIRIGLLTGSPDGVMGPKTRNAISAYEQTRGMPVDGKPSQALLADLQKN